MSGARERERMKNMAGCSISIKKFLRERYIQKLLRERRQKFVGETSVENEKHRRRTYEVTETDCDEQNEIGMRQIWT